MLKSLSQIDLENLSPELLRVFVKQNNFLAGEIDLTERIFYSVPRSTKNLFYLFHGDEGGLGLSDELLHLEQFDIIKIKFNNHILMTSRRKWLSAGILSPFCDSKIDRQIIVKVSNINMDDADRYELQKIQQELFQEAI